MKLTKREKKQKKRAKSKVLVEWPPGYRVSLAQSWSSEINDYKYFHMIRYKWAHHYMPKNWEVIYTNKK